MRRKAISIRLSLFLYGFIPMFICSLLLSIILLTLTTKLLKSREESNLISETRMLSSLLDNELRMMKRVSLNLAYSNQLRTAVIGYNQLRYEGGDPTEQYYGARRIQSIMDEMAGPLRQIPQINIIFPDFGMVSFGIYNLVQTLPEYHESRMRLFFKENRVSYWSVPERDSLSEGITGGNIRTNYISHYQTLYDDFRNPLGYIEVKQDMESLFSKVTAINSSFKVFNKENLQIFPMTQPYGNSFTVPSSDVLPYSIIKKVNELTGQREVLCTGITTEASWRILNIENEDTYLIPVTNIQKILIPIVLLIGLAGYLISHQLSLGISVPLSNLSGKLNQVQWNREQETDRIPEMTSIVELNDLEVSFSEMNRKMDEKLDLFVAEKTLEVNSRMLALQSQMDPHFLFNMLSIIGIMAEEDQMEEIQTVISHLSTLLRYVSSLQEHTVPLRTETQMAGHYMECIAFRFGENIQFRLDVNRKYDERQIPKYSIIPLLENAVKYGMSDDRPCRISVTYYEESDKWYLKVEDNGPGIPEAELAAILGRIEQGLHNPQMQLDNHINGLGLINLCSRYSLLFGRDFHLDAGNKPDGGLYVILGGISLEQS